MQLFCFLTNTLNRAVINALNIIFLTYWFVELTSLTTTTKKPTPITSKVILNLTQQYVLHLSFSFFANNNDISVNYLILETHEIQGCFVSVPRPGTMKVFLLFLPPRHKVKNTNNKNILESQMWDETVSKVYWLHHSLWPTSLINCQKESWVCNLMIGILGTAILFLS